MYANTHRFDGKTNSSDNNRVSTNINTISGICNSSDIWKTNSNKNYSNGQEEKMSTEQQE